MRAGIIRGDIPGPVFLGDLESVSQHNPSVDPPGQARYLSRPTVASVEAVLADPTVGAGATLNGGDISGDFPLTINAGNDDLKIRTSPAPTAFTTVLIAQAAYASLTTLLAAVNTALTGTGVTARVNAAGNGVALESDTKGVGSYLENDSVVGGSVANTPLDLADGAARSMPSAAAFITDLLPVGGPLDVSTATINGVGAGTNSNALALIPASRGTQTALADAVAPRFAETPVAEDSFLAGMLGKLSGANFNPDPNLLPDGAGAEVVEDDGSTAYGFAAPVITTADLTADDVTITGTDLSGPGAPTSDRKDTVVKFTGTGTPGSGNVKHLTLEQGLIEANGGYVTSTEIFIPAVLNPGFAVTTTFVQIRHRTHASNVEPLTT